MSLDKDGVCLQEKTAQSRAPLGVVRDKELIARIVFLPVGVSENGSLSQNQLKIDDLIANKGWSFMRTSENHRSFMPTVIKEWVRRRTFSKHSFSKYGYATVKVSDVRGIVDNSGIRALCVIDDADINDEHVLVTQPRPVGKDVARKIRRKIIQYFDLVVNPNAVI